MVCGNWEQGAGNNIYTEEGRSMRRMEKCEQAGISEFVLLNSYSCDGQRKENEQSRFCGTLGEK
jgi:hypothetical protein